MHSTLLRLALDTITETTTISYSYDPLYRLTGASYTGTLTNTFASTYDAVGNRLTQNASGTVISYTYDIANRLTNVNGVTYGWDNNGNLLSDGAKSYGYDQANRLKQVVQGAITTTMAYNGVGDRLSQTVGAATTHYVLDPAAGLTQVLSDGTNTYLYGNDRLAQYQGAMQYFGPDALGSVRQIYDASAQVIGNARYDPYGNVLAQNGATSVFAFAGEQRDATGLTYLRARYYSAAQGRFTTRDVWEGDPDRAQTLNRYAYVTDNPVTFTDPSGYDQPVAGALVGPAAGVCALLGPACYGVAFAVGVPIYMLYWSVYGPHPIPTALPPYAPGPTYPTPGAQWRPQPKVRDPNKLPLADSGPEAGKTPQLYPKSQPEPKSTPPPFPAPPCPRSDKQPFYYAVRAYDTEADYRRGYDALYSRLLNSGLPGADGLAASLQGQWNYFNNTTQRQSGYPEYAGWAYQSQRALYFQSHGLATVVKARGIPDVAVNWSTGGTPSRIEAVEQKFKQSGQGFIEELRKPLRTLPSEWDRYQAEYPGKWLLEVNRLTTIGQIELQREGGIPFDSHLYP